MKRKDRRWVFFSVFFFSMLFSMLYLAVNRHASGAEQFLYDRGHNLLGDFINNLHYPTHEKGPYFDSIWASFPPLAYTFYYLFNVCFTRGQYIYELLAYMMITSFTAVLMYFAIAEILKNHRSAAQNSEALLMTSCLLLSGASVYTVERGNSVFNVMVMLLWAFAFRDNARGWKRELALLLIAVAANFKLYPAVFGLIYLFEKRWREACRLLIYGVVLFVVPFAWFGGADGFRQFLYNQSMIHTLLFDRYFTSVPSIAVFLAAEFGWDSHAALQTGQMLSLLLAAVLIAAFVMEKRLWSRCLLLCSSFILIPGWSAEYMAVYMALPLVLCYCCAVHEKYFALYMALFAGVFILLPFGVHFPVHTDLSWNTVVSFGSIYGLTLLACSDAFLSFLAARKRCASSVGSA